MKPRLAGDAGGGSVGLSVLGAPPAAPGRQRDIADLASRMVVAALFTWMAVRLGLDYLETGRHTGLLLVASEALVVVLTVFRRAPAVVDRTLRARVLTTLSMLGPPLVRPAMIAPLAPEAATVAISMCGLVVVILGKISLGRMVMPGSLKP